jgi:rhamnulokinase
MKTQCYLGVDLGAESGRVMAGLWDGKRMRLDEVHRFGNGAVELGGTLRWNVLGLWGEIQDGISLAGRAYQDAIQSIGVDTWGVDFVLLSETDELLGLPYHYRDPRTRGMLKQALARVSREAIFEASGLQFMEINTLYQLLALKQRSPEVLESANCLLMIPDFLNWCLSGRRVAEFTNATTTQFFHPVLRTWSVELLKKLGLPTKFLPEVVSPGTRLGKMRATVAERAGIGRIPVIAPATHDTGSAVVGVPAVGREQGTWAYLSSGTWSLIGVEIDQAALSPSVLKYNLTNEGGVDGTYRLLKNIAGLWLLQQSRKAFEAKGFAYNYAKLVALAKAAPALRSLIDPDHSDFANPPNMPAAIQQFCRRTGQTVPATEGQIVRCILESLALKYHQVLGRLESVTGNAIEVIHIVGGGSRNRLLNQFTANACNTLVVAGPVEATALGNVLVQARACGELGSLAEIREVVAASSELKTFEPERKCLAAWQHARHRFASLTPK